MKLDYSVMIEAGIPEAAIKRFIEYRKLKKKPLNQRSLEMNMREAHKAQQIGITPEQAIDYSIYRGWQGIKANWLKNSLEDIKSLYTEIVEIPKNKPTRDMTTAEMMDTGWAL